MRGPRALLAVARIQALARVRGPARSPIGIEPLPLTVVTASLIDTSFDVRMDAGGGDPDRYSTTLRRYHQQLWGKPLPSGAMFDLDARLHHTSDLGEFWLSSDSIVHTYTRWVSPISLARRSRGDPVGGADRVLRPCLHGRRLPGLPVRHPYVDGKQQQTINQRRGMHPLIRDRFDLTLECIRRHYAGSASPLGEVLANPRGLLQPF